MDPGRHRDADGADADRADRRSPARPGVARGVGGPDDRAAARPAPDHAGPGHRPWRDPGQHRPGGGPGPVLRNGPAPAAGLGLARAGPGARWAWRGLVYGSGRRASASISTSQAGSSSPDTTTAVEAG